MLKEKHGDLLNSEATIFCHQCNCFAKMGAGIAKQIANTYPIVRRADYDRYTKLGTDGIFGTILPVQLPDTKVCINMYAQKFYGRGKRQTDYDAFKKCLDAIKEWAKTEANEFDVIGFPGYIGCGLAGGDWNIVKQMITEFSKEITQDVVIVYFQ